VPEKRSFFIITLGIIILGIASSGFGYDLEKRVQSYTLKNGLKILMVERHLSPTVSFYIRHRVGAVDESDGKTGAAHLLEHMMFKGTKTIGAKNYRKEQRILDRIFKTGNEIDLITRKATDADRKRLEFLKNRLETLQKEHKTLFIENEIDRLYTENGADDSNASTGQDLTTYNVSLPSNKIELWARIESDRMVNPVFRDFYTERSVVMEERKQRIDSDPEGQLFERFFAAAFMCHPYRRPIIGWAYDIRYLDPQYLLTLFKRYHAPNNTVIAIVGDIDHASTLKIVQKYFGHIPPQDTGMPFVTEEPSQKGERRIQIESDANPHVLIGYHKPAMPSFDDYVFDVIDSILSRGRTSRLYKTLVEEKGIAESINTINGMPGSRYPNLFVISAKPRHPHTDAELESAIYEELEKIKTSRVLERELEKTKNQLKADFIRNLDSNRGLANMLSYFEILTGDYRYITNHVNVIERVSSDDIMRVATRYLTRDNRTVANLMKKK
jgi:predicted Zn-dependent peptidase